MPSSSSRVASSPSTSEEVHHVIQTAVVENGDFFKLIDSNWVELPQNKLVLPNDPDIAAVSGMPLRDGSHPWIDAAQRKIFNDFLETRTFGPNGLTGQAIVDALTKDQPVDPAVLAEARAAALEFANGVRDLFTKAIVDGLTRSRTHEAQQVHRRADYLDFEGAGGRLWIKPVIPLDLSMTTG